MLRAMVVGKIWWPGIAAFQPISLWKESGITTEGCLTDQEVSLPFIGTTTHYHDNEEPAGSGYQGSMLQAMHCIYNLWCMSGLGGG